MRPIRDILPKRLVPTRRGTQSNGLSDELLQAAHSDTAATVAALRTRSIGLTQSEAERRLREYGPNVVARDEGHGRLASAPKALLNPLVVLLALLATVSFATGDARAGIVMVLMVVLGVVLRFVQESRADAAAELRAMISVTATVLRDGKPREVPLAELVPGDVVKLAAGDMIPADVRLLSCKDLFLIQAQPDRRVVPGREVRPPGKTPTGRSPLELTNVCFLGTSVESGAATAVVVATGLTTYLGGMASAIVDQQRPDQLRPGHEPVHLADDLLHPRHGPAGLPHQRADQGRLEGGLLLRPGRGGGADARRCCR